jgi:bifunctional DNase/RNase
MREVRLVGVRVDLRSRNPVVFLQEESTRRAIPIFIGTYEATAIADAMDHTYVPRPLTHDLQVDVIEALGASLVRVVVTEIRDGTYFAELHLDAGGTPVVVSARPSDAIAIAARTDAAIFVADDLLDTAGVMLEEIEIDLGDDGEEPDAAVVDEFREFLDNVRPEDFSG